MTFLAVALLALLPVAQRIADGVDARLRVADPTNGLARFYGYPSGAANDRFTPNPKFWAKDVDFSCASPWNSQGGPLRAGALVSKRHIVFAQHFPIGKGTRISFVDNEGVVCACRIAGVRPIQGTDITVASLDYEVTPNIHPAKILPQNYGEFIGSGTGLPIVTFDKNERLTVSDWWEVPTNGVWRIGKGVYPKDQRRQAFVSALKSGDSGNPAFLIVGNEPVLLYNLHGGGCGSGSAMHSFRKEIQAAMDELCPGYKLESFDFAAIERK